MRVRDQEKYDRIVQSTVSLANEIGFSGISISKIAQKAQISPATIYIYFSNKDDLLRQVYIEIRDKMSHAALQSQTSELTLEKSFKALWRDYLQFALQHPEFIPYREQFERTPLMKGIDTKKFAVQQKIADIYTNGRKNQIIKAENLEIFTAFAFMPLISIINFYHSGILSVSEENVENLADMAWQAVRNG